MGLYPAAGSAKGHKIDTFISKYGGKLGEGFSKAEKLLATQHPGRQTDPRKGYQSAVAWISDLIALRKVVILCSYCRAKFNPRRFGYRQVYVGDDTGKTDGYCVNGQCDSCKQETSSFSEGGRAFQPEELYLQTHRDPSEARRHARIAARRTTTAWDVIRREAQRKAQAITGG